MTTGDNVFPGSFSSARSGNNMVQIQFLLWKLLRAVLTGELVSNKNMGPGKSHASLRKSFKFVEDNNSRYGHKACKRSNKMKILRSR